MQKLFYFIVHFLFWTTFAAISWVSLSVNPDELGFVTNHYGVAAILGIWGAINFYSFYFYFQPVYLDVRKYLQYLLASVIFSPVVSFFFVGLFWIIYPLFREYAAQKLVEGMIGTFLISQCGSLLAGFISWNKNLQNKTALENQSLRNELAMLKAQLSPHFLLNTLNNIDTLIYRSQEEASAMLIKLGSLLRYMLYESEEKEVPIEKEIAYIEQLTELQRIRFEQPDFVELEVSNSSNEVTIAPLIFLPFIENAFKFVSKPPKMPAIVIQLEATNKQVRLLCRNHFHSSKRTNDQKREGIGLANARRRLELLYPKAFNLQLEKKDSMFEVDLHIRLK